MRFPVSEARMRKGSVLIDDATSQYRVEMGYSPEHHKFIINVRDICNDGDVVSSSSVDGDNYAAAMVEFDRVFSRVSGGN